MTTTPFQIRKNIGGTQGNSSGAFQAPIMLSGAGKSAPSNVVTVVDAAINPAVANTLYLVGPITANRAVTMPAGTTPGQVIEFLLVGPNGNTDDLIITCPAALAPGSTISGNTTNNPVGAVAAGGNTILTIAGDTNGGGGVGSRAVFVSTGTTWRCTANLIGQGDGSVADASAFS